jgi:hypothetical protein
MWHHPMSFVVNTGARVHVSGLTGANACFGLNKSAEASLNLKSWQ